jgi:hypothetical protein
VITTFPRACSEALSESAEMVAAMLEQMEAPTRT